MKSGQKYITSYQNLSDYLGMPIETVKNNVQNGIIPKRKLGVNVIFSIEEVDKAISEVLNDAAS